MVHLGGPSMADQPLDGPVYMGNSTCPGTSVLTWTIPGLDIINNPQKSEMEGEGAGKGRMKLGNR
jgi:hypothetical protein